MLLSVTRAARAAECALIHRRVFETPWDEAALCDLMNGDGARTFVVKKTPRGRAAGFVLGRIAADESEILTLAVLPEWRRQGAGRALVEALIETLRRDGARRLFLEAAVSNRPALALYRDLGFVETGRRPDYYERKGKPPEDALVLARDLHEPCLFSPLEDDRLRP